MENGRRGTWRLKLHVPDLESVDREPLFEWLRDSLIPAILAAPFRVTLELVQPDDRADDDGIEEPA